METEGYLANDPSCHGFHRQTARNPQAAAFRRKHGPVVTTTRIGISVAEHLPLRFYLDRSEFVSKRERRVNSKPTH